MKQFSYKSRTILSFIGLFLILVGVIISFKLNNNEPLETIGGFLCGFGLGLSLLFFTLKK